MVFPVAGGTQDTALNIDNSCRFYSNTDLKRLPSSTGSSLKATMSAWVKFSNTDEVAIIGGWDNSGANDDDGYMVFKRLSTGELQFNGGDDVYLKTTGKYRDLTAWYHIVLAIDSTQNDNNAQRIYVNGSEVTSFATRNNLTNLQDLPMNTTAGNDDALLIGCDEDTGGKGLHLEGYISEFFWIDGTQYAASDFGEFNDNGVWIPKKGSKVVGDLTMGTNGVYLEFKETGTSANSSGIGADTSGNNLHFTVTNLIAQDITEDTPTNNFATLNPLMASLPTNAIRQSLFEGATGSWTSSADQAADYRQWSTIAIPHTGKWYVETKWTRNENDHEKARMGILAYHDDVTHGVVLDGDFDKIVNGSSSSYATGSVAYGEIFGALYDLENNEVTFYEAGSSLGTISWTPNSTYTYYHVVFADSQSLEYIVNFGNPAFSISSGNEDPDGYGNFEYGTNSGYALCTKNLAEYG